MPDPQSMSLAATLVMAAVAIVLAVAWLAVVFRAASHPAGVAGRADRGHTGES